MGVDGHQEALVELEGAGELLRQLPHTLQELVQDRGHLLRVAVQVGVPAEGHTLRATRRVLTEPGRKNPVLVLELPGSDPDPVRLTDL